MKKLALCLMFVMCGFAVQASYLYWTVNNSYEMQNTGVTYTWSGTLPSEENTFHIGRVMQVDGDGVATQLGAAQYTTTEGGNQKTYSISISENTQYGYYIELLSWDGTKYNQVGLTETKTYADLNTAGVIYNSDNLSPVPTATWHGGGSMNAPEPTSAVLMLLGVAGLALRRKQRKSAE